MLKKKKAPPFRKEGKHGEEIAKITIAFAGGKTKEIKTPSFVLVSVNENQAAREIHITGRIFNALIISDQLARAKNEVDACIEKRMKKDVSGLFARMEKAIEENDTPDPFPEFVIDGGDDNT